MIVNFAKAEPILAILVAGLTLVPAVIGVLAAFGHPLTDVQQHAIGALAVAVGALIARSQVSPT